MPFTPKQQRFIDEYVILDAAGHIPLNATQAYRRAYPKCKSDRAAGAAAARLLGNVSIREAIDARLAKLSRVARITAEDAWRELGHIARSDIGDILDFTGIEPKLKPVNEIPEYARRAIKSVKVKRYTEGHGDQAREVEVMEFAFWDKPGQINTTLRALGELKDKVEHSGPGGAAIPLHHTGNVTHDPTLQAADAAYAESLADAVLDSVAPQAEDRPADGGIHADGGSQSVDQERPAGHGENA